MSSFTQRRSAGSDEAFVPYFDDHRRRRRRWQRRGRDPGAGSVADAFERTGFATRAQDERECGDQPHDVWDAHARHDVKCATVQRIPTVISLRSLDARSHDCRNPLGI